MAQVNSKAEETHHHHNHRSTTSVGFKFNVHAPEFVPASRPLATATTMPGYLYPCLHFVGDDWFFFSDQEPVHFVGQSTQFRVSDDYNPGGTLGDDALQNIVKQVEYQLSNANLILNDSLMRLINKDPEGFVPISAVVPPKKKSLNISMLAMALRASSKLVVSQDGKRVRRKNLFTERDKEELQSRIVVVENLPEDYSRQNLEKIFGVAGSVKNVRICHPQESKSARSSKIDVLISNKFKHKRIHFDLQLHALVEFETTNQAEKANFQVEKLNDERNWRKGLRVRLLLRRSPRSVIRTRKSDYDRFDALNSEDDDEPHQPDSSSPSKEPQQGEATAEENPFKKGWVRGRGKSRGRGTQAYNGRGLSSASSSIGEAPGRPASGSPRMPDGTRGFTMGRGKPARTVSGAL
ncbi:hypothetical protein QJS04_geneDACA005701 [Acorus gramineus]|uniref:La-related protein 6C n=1 Tax=Acorus gramineus TaxID=55184 RepID=A0AAV9BGW4_ACOGR|nr:hypothetical protein QJS04_geneDACA005701 [Acorus gramineus]